MKHFNRQVIRFRTLRGWTQAHMAQFCKVSRAKIIDVEKHRRISLRLEGKIRAAMEVQGAGR